MERVAQVFATFEDADLADVRYYASLEPSQRVDILLELIELHPSTLGESAQRFERVCRVTRLAER